jgi:hypothetical protein
LSKIIATCATQQQGVCIQVVNTISSQVLLRLYGLPLHGLLLRLYGPPLPCQLLSLLEYQAEA